MADNEDPEFLVEILTTNPLASTDRQDFQRATAKELVDKYKMSPERLLTPLPEWTAAQPFPGEVTCAGE